MDNPEYGGYSLSGLRDIGSLVIFTFKGSGRNRPEMFTFRVRVQ